MGTRESDTLPRLKLCGSRSQTGQSTAGGPPLGRDGVVGRARTVPDRDSGFQLPPREVRILTMLWGSSFTRIFIRIRWLRNQVSLGEFVLADMRVLLGGFRHVSDPGWCGFGNHPPYGLNVWTVNRCPNHMIMKPRVLQPEFVPGDVKHRDAQINTLSTALEPVIEGNRATHSILHGPTGSGKTCIARYTVDRLQNNAKIHSHYVDCWDRRTRSAVLYDMLDGVNRAATVHRNSTPPDQLRDRLEDTIDMPYVVILDEVDQLEDTDVIHDLYETSGLTMILVTDRVEEVAADMDTRMNSRLTVFSRIVFDRYSLDELVAILRDRARLGLANDAVGQAELEYIADQAAGDARHAIGILRNAAQDAKNEGRETLSDDLIEDAVHSATRDTQEAVVNRLTPEQQVVYDIIAEQSPISTGEIHDRYCEEVDDPKTMRTIRNWLSKLVRYNIIEYTGNTKDRRYHPIS
jgi:orc1/cdc6 family replication initiation protein